MRRRSLPSADVGPPSLGSRRCLQSVTCTSDCTESAWHQCSTICRCSWSFVRWRGKTVGITHSRLASKCQSIRCIIFLESCFFSSFPRDSTCVVTYCRPSFPSGCVRSMHRKKSSVITVLVCHYPGIHCLTARTFVAESSTLTNTSAWQLYAGLLMDVFLRRELRLEYSWHHRDIKQNRAQGFTWRYRDTLRYSSRPRQKRIHLQR